MIVWKPIPNYPNYLVSNAGNVRSLKYGRDRLLSIQESRGYQQVGLYVGRRVLCKVHQLVMLAFVGPRPEGMDVRHLNGIRSDNHLENLKYGTRKENMEDKILHGNDLNASKTHCKQGHQFDLLNTYISKYEDGSFRHRRCTTCHRIRTRNYRSIKKESRKINEQ